MSPQTLLSSKWPELIGGVIFAPAAVPCNSATFDYFVVSQGLAQAVAEVARLDDAGLNPHFPARLFIKSACRRTLVRKLIRPVRVPGALPAGPLPQPCSAPGLRPTSVDAVAIDAAMSAWSNAARVEWASLCGEDPDLSQPRFAWREPVGPRAQQKAGATKLSIFWRNVAQRFDEVARLIERRGPDGAFLARRHVFKCSLAIAGLDDVDGVRQLADEWFKAMIGACNAGDVLVMRRLIAVARKRAKVVEDRNQRQKAAEWRKSLGMQRSDPNAPMAPTKRAFQWVRGTAGWSKSPVGEAWRNDIVPDLDDLCDLPPGGDDPDGGRQRLVQGPRDATLTPLSDQADVDKEGDGWAALWREDQPYDCFIDPLGSPALEPLVPWAIRESAKSFPMSTGVGADNTSPRAVARLSDVLIKALCAILMACELWGAWPALVRYVLIVLLPKSDGGRRPIGLFPSIVRVWSRARVIVARAWESAHFRPTIFGGAGMGAQRAAWVSAFKAEAAARKDAAFTQSLLDLVKAFEQIPHRVLAHYAAKHGYNLVAAPFPGGV